MSYDLEVMNFLFFFIPLQFVSQKKPRFLRGSLFDINIV